MISKFLNNSVVDTNMLSTRKSKHQTSRPPIRTNECLNDFVGDNNTQVGVTEDEKKEPQNDGVVDIFWSETLGQNSASHYQVIEKNIANKVRKEVDSVVAAVQNPAQDAVSVARDDMVIPSVKKAVRPITGSSGR